MTGPAGGATYTAPAGITISASASDADGAVSRVDFYAGTQLVGTDYASPYGVTWGNVSAGTYTLKAVATDDRGAATTSASVTVYVNRVTLPRTSNGRGGVCVLRSISLAGSRGSRTRAASQAA